MIFYILDLLTVIILILSNILPNNLILYSGIYLFLKGIIFIIISKDIASVIDFICGIYMVIMFFNFKIYFLTVLCIIWLLQKTAVYFIIKIGG
ncbi:hypothetical protein HN789_06460 [archaeon]|jgi:hypothetical protein|nr:hypothetical protein [archaeon]MBT4022794.1 hypothetical protein [archaeon]MBT4273012.1 hypothetical protein [archaeon]MBT4460897.1 hypothetical protein [archaeon]MBT4858113.1 hypothetical protein [archaeon]